MGIAKEICRIEKIKSIGALGGAYQHNLRLKDIANADETKTSYNIELTERLPQNSYVDYFHDKINSSPWYENGKHKIAKNAIYAVEFMLTFGNEANGKIDIDTWCHDNMKWLSANFGGSQNIVSAILHLDERTPHIHAIVVPLDEKGKLNYTKYLGGSKYRLSELQDNYHTEVGQFHNLDRGLKGSKAHHQDIDNFYSMVNETVSSIKLPQPEQKTGLFKKVETAVEYRERISPVIQHAHSVCIAKQAENALLKKRITDIEHLQEGVVPADLYEKTLSELQSTKNQLEEQKKENLFCRNWAMESQKKYDDLDRTLPEKISAAITKTTSVLQAIVDEQKAKYQKINQDFDKLMKSYTSLETKYLDIQEKYSTLKKKSENIGKLEYDRELMYAIMDNNGISNIYDKHKRNLDDGLIMGARLEIAKYKSRHQPLSQQPRTSHRTQVR
jgi:hypothetical protein